MNFKDLSGLKTDELEKKEKEAKFELVKLQGQVATGTPPKSPSQIRELKKIIARINTIRSAEKIAVNASDKKNN